MSNPKQLESVPAQFQPHAAIAAQAHARHLLVEAVEQMDEARRATCPPEARGFDLWKGIAASRWTLVDHFESGGRRYAVALRNDDASDGFEALSPRELEVVAASARGLSNKCVAYDMGLSVSTIRVLLHRATKKLGVATREELMARYLARSESSRSLRTDHPSNNEISSPGR